MKQFLIIRQGDGVVAGTALQDDPDTGPIKPQQPAQEGFDLVPFDGEFSRAGKDHCVATWDGSAVVWSADLELLRAARREQINAWWLEANGTYFEFRGARIAYGETDRVDIQGINNVVMLTGAMPANPDWPAAWKTLDNDWVPIPDVAAWVEFNIAIADRGTAHFKRAQLLKTQLEAATTAAEIEAITW